MLLHGTPRNELPDAERETILAGWRDRKAVWVAMLFCPLGPLRASAVYPTSQGLQRCQSSAAHSGARRQSCEHQSHCRHGAGRCRGATRAWGAVMRLQVGWWHAGESETRCSAVSERHSSSITVDFMRNCIRPSHISEAGQQPCFTAPWDTHRGRTGKVRDTSLRLQREAYRGAHGTRGKVHASSTKGRGVPRGRFAGRAPGTYAQRGGL